MARKGKAKAKVTPKKRAVETDDSDIEANNIEFLLTDPKSALVDFNLTVRPLLPSAKPFTSKNVLKEAVSSPAFWPSLTEEERDSILELIPDFVERRDDGSVPDDFWRFNNEWRAAVRQFQENLSLGKYDPSWLAEGAQAMEERAHGDFDAWKEKEFEEFWGQKQKVSHDARAGNATSVKLSVLVENGLFQIGDIWSYVRCFGRGDQAVIVEKDCELIEIKGAEFLFAVPGGTRRYHFRPLGKEGQGDKTSKHDLALRSPKYTETVTSAQPGEPNGEVPVRKASSPSINGCRDYSKEPIPEKTAGTSNPSSPVQQIPSKPSTSTSSSPLSSARSDLSEPPSLMLDSLKPETPMGHSNTDAPHEASLTVPTLQIAIRIPSALENSILKIDGRVRNAPNGNAWKSFRLIRHNQDLGSLFDVRDQFCVENGI